MDKINSPKGVGMFADDHGLEDGHGLSDGSRYLAEKMGDLIIGLSSLLLKGK